MSIPDENRDVPDWLAGGLTWGGVGLTLVLAGLAIGLVLAPPDRTVRPIPAIAGNALPGPGATDEAGATGSRDRVAASWVSGAGGWAGPGRVAGTTEPPPHRPLPGGLRNRREETRATGTTEAAAPLVAADRRERVFVAASAAAVARAAPRERPRAVPAALPPVPARPSPAAPAPRDGKPRIAIVVDDLGPARAAAATVALPAPLTLAILPYADNAPALAREARAHGHEVIVHLPMQPFDPGKYPGPRALRPGQSPEARLADLAWHLGRFDGYVGVNNHMGSRATSDLATMRQVLGEIARRGLYFLDSVTAESSVAASTARSLGMPHAVRDVFLDHRIDAAETRRRLAQLEAIARRRGYAIAIGHPHPSTLRVLQSWLASAPGRGFRLVPVSDLLSPGQIAVRDSRQALR